MIRRVVLAIAFILFAAPSHSAELNVLGAGPVEHVFKELAVAFARDTGHKVEGTFNTVGYIQNLLKNGAKADVLVLSDKVMEEMEKAGGIVAGSRIEIGRASAGFAVRAGAPAPDISSAEAMKKTLVAARSVAYVDPAGGGSTGIHFARALERLGIADEVNRKSIRPQRGSQVADAVADGRAEIGNTNLTELVPHKGVKVIGLLPDPYGLVIPYVAGVTSASTSKDAAWALLAVLTSAAAREKFKAAGL